MSRKPPVILVVEDEESDQFFIKAAFKEAGVTGPIVTLGSGEAAISYLMGEGPYRDRMSHPYPDFIITDLHMPGSDGFDLLQHLKLNPTWRIVPTIVLSSSADPHDIAMAYILGASAYHVKPPDPGGLRRLTSLLYGYWMSCDVPVVDSSGRWLLGFADNKLGNSSAHPVDRPQHRI